MDTRQIEAIGAICAMAALADGSTSSTERERIEGIFKGLSDGAGDEARALATAYRRVMMKQTSVEAEANALGSPEARAYAYEMAVAVCDADGRHSDAEGRFLETLRAALGLSGAEAATVLGQADELAEIDLTAPVAATAAAAVGAGAVAAAALPRTAPVPPPDARNVSAEVDSSILKYSILNGALELLPQGLATMAIVPLQMKMVYGVGKAYGFSLDKGHVKELIATVGVGMTSQVVEGFARDLLGGLAKKFLGKTAGKVVKTATGAAMSFATTYALGQVAKQYYAGGRKLSSVDLRALFGREVERAKGLYAQHRPQIEQSAKTLDPRQVLSMVRGA
ncbi:MAG: GTPase [Phycisphaera sp.]|nr:GTPase [Phycisphaera sp.]